MSDTSRNLAQWRVPLPEFTLDIVTRAGIKLRAADAIFRLPAGRTDKIKLGDEIMVLEITTDMTNTDKTE